MTKVKYTTRTGKQQWKPVIPENEFWKLDGDGTGFCLACGSEQDGCEPDARQYECNSCGERKVYGLSELLMMNLVEIK